MFRRFKLDITGYARAGANNCIAIKIYQVDHPGVPTPGTQLKVFGPVRGHSYDIFKDETLKISGGWDCAPVVRDRNMGIYQKVIVEATDEVLIENPFVITTLPKSTTMPMKVDTGLAKVNIKQPNRRSPANAPHCGQNPTKGARESPSASAAPTKAQLSGWEQLATQEYGIKVTSYK